MATGEDSKGETECAAVNNVHFIFNCAPRSPDDRTSFYAAMSTMGYAIR